MPTFSHLKKTVLALAVFGLVSVFSSTAKADIVVTNGVNNQGTNNVLLNPATDVLTGWCRAPHGAIALGGLRRNPAFGAKRR